MCCIVQREPKAVSLEWASRTAPTAIGAMSFSPEVDADLGEATARTAAARRMNKARRFGATVSRDSGVC